MDSKTVVGKSHEHASFANGEHLAKMPTATMEQLNFAKVLSKPGKASDAELERSVSLLQDLTKCTEDEAVTALYDCENNIQKAVELLLDKMRAGVNEDWHTTGRKSRVKHVSVNVSEPSHSTHSKEDHRTTDKHKRSGNVTKNPQVKSDGSVGSNKLDSQDLPVNTKNMRTHKHVKNANTTSTESVESRPKESNSKPATRNVAFKEQRSGTKHLGYSDGWDPYTEYGEWGGEAIEVINSNASLARGLQTESAPAEDLFVDTDNKIVQEQSSTRTTDSSLDALSPKSVPHADEDSLFISKCLSKPPPPAFTKLPDVPVFIVPDALPQTASNFSFRFGGDQVTSFRTSPATNSAVGLSKSPSSTNKQTSAPADMESVLYPASPTRCQLPSYELSKSSSGTMVTGASSSEAKVETASQNFAPNQFQNVNLTPKSPNTFSAAPTTQSNTPFTSERANHQQGFLESSLKNYLLDNLPGGISKLSVANSSVQNDAPSHFTLPGASQSQSVNSSFPHSQPSSSSNGNTIQQQLNKTQVPHATTHGSYHSSQQPLCSSASQQPQTTPLPPGMTHFISQFAPTPYHMFNLPANSSNAPAMLEQLFHQQHRMFYDMHMHQQAVTTSQSMLTSSSEASATSKPHAVPGPMNHVPATGAAIRPDLLASAMGHAPQMLPTGHPFFSYPSFVLMNGYPNTFMNQQQAGADSNGPTQGSGHGGSTLTQAPTQSSASQSFSGMKPMSAAYEEFLDMKYGDPSKQVGYKSQSSTNFGNFPGHMPPAVDVPKLPAGHSTANGVLNPAFGAGNSGNAQPFLPQYYQPNNSTSAYLNAAVAVAQQQQQQQGQTTAANQSNAVGSSGQTGGNPGGHQLGNNSHAQSMVLGSGSGLHHHQSQRPVMSHQH